MITLNNICFFIAGIIFTYSFMNVNVNFFFNSYCRNERIKKNIQLICISPFMLHIVSQLIVVFIMRIAHDNTALILFHSGTDNVEIISSIILVQLILLPMVLYIYGRIIKEDKRTCIFIYVTFLDIISFTNEAATNAVVALLIAIFTVFAINKLFYNSIKAIIKEADMSNYNAIVLIPIFAYIMIFLLGFLYSIVPAKQRIFCTIFSFILYVFYIFVFTSYEKSVSNYIKKVEDLNEVNKKKDILEVQNKTQEEIILSLAQITEAKSGQTGQHIKRVSEYTCVLAKALGFNYSDVEKIRIASMMHDVGKLVMPSEILEKKGKLTDGEFQIIKTHAALGKEILRNAKGPIMECARIIAFDHHEKWDGSGYHGKKGEDISIEGRIVAVADVYDALISKRSYKFAWSKEDAKNEIIKQRGIQFDPKVVDAFVEHYDEILHIAEKYDDCMKEYINN